MAVRDHIEAYLMGQLNRAAFQMHLIIMFSLFFLISKAPSMLLAGKGSCQQTSVWRQSEKKFQRCVRWRRGCFSEWWQFLSTTVMSMESQLKMITFDWALLFPCYLAEPGAVQLPEAPETRDCGSVCYRKCIRNTEVVYKDLYIRSYTTTLPEYQLYIICLYSLI